MKPPKLENIIWYRFECGDDSISWKGVMCFLNALHDAEINFHAIEQKCDDIVVHNGLKNYMINLLLNVKLEGDEFIVNIIEKLINFRRSFICKQLILPPKI